MMTHKALECLGTFRIDGVSLQERLLAQRVADTLCPPPPPPVNNDAVDALRYTLRYGVDTAIRNSNDFGVVTMSGAT